MKPPISHVSGPLTRSLLLLALPVMAEQVLHMIVGLTDTWLANRLGEQAANATAAVGTIAYLLWFVSLLVGLVSSGATALISRSIGGGDRAYAGHVAGQAVMLALVVGACFGGALLLFNGALADLTGLRGEARELARTYLVYLGCAMPFMTFLLTCSACLRGSGDSLTPAMVMAGVDITNAVLSFALVRGLWLLPRLGFEGIAVGTLVAYAGGAAAMLLVMLRGTRLPLHGRELRPRRATLVRLMRIGIPAAIDGVLAWLANFSIPLMLNRLDPSNIMSAAHLNAIRIESLSFLPGLAFAVAAATLVGQNLGAGQPARAARAAHLSYALGAAMMTLWGLAFIFLPGVLASAMAENPYIAAQSADCLFIAGFIQPFFAAALVYGGALRGAGATFTAMVLNLISVLGIRLPLVLLAGYGLGAGLTGVWLVLCGELVVRGLLMGGWFLTGRWRSTRV